MKVRSIGELTERIDEALAWRRKELLSFGLIVASNEGSIQKSLIRASVPLAYGHWEGFTKTAIQLYMAYVSTQGKTYAELKTEIVAFSRRGRLSAFGSHGFGMDHVSLIREIRAEEASRAIVPHDISDIDTESNLKSPVLRKLFLMSGLDVSIFSAADLMYIDDLVNRRNEVAHGGFTNGDFTEWKNDKSNILILLDSVKNSVINGAVTKMFLSERIVSAN